MNITTPALEIDQRVAVLNSLLTTPHRELQKVYDFHVQLVNNDPLFYVRLAAWYNKNGEVRDHKEMFIICLILSTFEGHRDVGLAMARELPPYQLARVVDFISGKHINKVTKTTVGKKTTYTKSKEKFGLFKNLPRSLKTEVERYLREREQDDVWFDSSAVSSKKDLKRFYGLFRIKPSDRAQAILFDNKPPEGSTAAQVKLLAKTVDPTEQAKLIIENKIPYRVASTVISAMTPTILLALIEVMSPQELINNMGSLNKRGVMDNPDLKAKVEEKLAKAKTNKRVSALKASEAIKAGNLSEDLARKLEDVADAKLKSKGRITKSTAILVDCSGSMSTAIEVGKRLGSVISAVMDAQLYVKCFNGLSYSITVPKKPDFAEWERAFNGIKANGNTSCGVGIVHLQKNNERVEQIIMITDEGENASPRFYTSLVDYQKFVGFPVKVIFIKVGRASNQLEEMCKRNDIEYEVIEFGGDYFSLPNIIPYLTKGSRTELLMEILDWKLPQRKAS